MTTDRSCLRRFLMSTGTGLLLCLPASGQRLFFEDFNRVPLGPNVEEMSAGEQVWTKTPPPDWVIDDSGMPGYGESDYELFDGMREWAGWAFADVTWWPTVDNQRRSEWVRASGAAAIADPDEWDDAPHRVGFFNSYLRSPAIDVSGSAPNTLVLFFDSSWRPEGFDDGTPRFPVGPNGERLNNQTAVLTARWDNGPELEVLRWDSDLNGEFFKPDNPNDAVLLELSNPAGAQRLTLTFGLINAANDWWWAVDNVTVGRPPMLTALQGRGNGFSARIIQTAGARVVPDSVTVRLDGTPVPVNVVPSDEGAELGLEELVVHYEQSPLIFPPDSAHEVEVSFRTSDGRTVTDRGTFIAPGYTTLRATPLALVATLTETDYLTVDSSRGVQLTLNGSAVTTHTLTRQEPDRWILRYQFPTPPPALSEHQLRVAFTTHTGQVVEQTLRFRIPAYVEVPPALATAPGTGRTPGLRWRTHQLPSDRLLGNSIAGAEAQLRGEYGESVHDPTFAGPDSFFEIAYVNFEQSSGPAGNFRVTATEPGEDIADDFIPGIPGMTGSDNHIAAEVLAYLEFPAAGVYGMVVNSDDGFQVSTGNSADPTHLVLGKFDAGRGAADTEFYFRIQTPGVYLFRLLYFEGTGGASVEWFTVNAAGARLLINGPQPGALKAYRQRSVAEPNLPVIPTLSALRQGSNLVLQYTGTLQQATRVEGPYTDVPGAGSPHTVPLQSEPAAFFRARQ